MGISFTKLCKKVFELRQKKFLVFGILCGFLLFFILSIAVYLSVRSDLHRVQNFANSVLNNQTENFDRNYREFSKTVFKWSRRLETANSLSFNLLESRFHLKKGLVFLESVVPSLPEILGRNGTKIYFVLLQNDKELRPTGGFLGSYAKLKFDNGGLSNIVIQDVYVPDGQIVGHVDPPAPIQEAFGQGWWKLRDSNWDPDFSKAAKIIAWFFEKGKEERADGTIAVNFSLFEQLLGVFGPLKLINYQEPVSASNLYQIAQSYSEADFFPGSTQKKDIISNLGLALLDKTKSMGTKQLLMTLPIILKNLERRQILFYFTEGQTQSVFSQAELTGEISGLGLSQKGQFADYLYVVEANLGANKANCCVERQVEQQVDFTEGEMVEETVTVWFNNFSKLTTPTPPFFWGGNYINFLRFYLPADSGQIKVIFDGKEIVKEKWLTEERKEKSIIGFGFFITVPAGSEKSVIISYVRPKTQTDNYHLRVQKQPGIKSFPYNLKVIRRKGKTLLIKKEIIKDEEISL